MKRTLLICLLAASPCLQASAQSYAQGAATPPPLGPGPLIARSPAMSQWLISTKSGSPGDAVAPDAKSKYDQRTLVVKTGDVRHEITAYADGSQAERWCQGSTEVNISPGTKVINITSHMEGVGGFSNYVDYSKSDFSGFEWIKRNNYTGVQVMEGINCIVFHMEPSGAASSGTSSTVGSANQQTNAAIPPDGCTAYIEADNRLPVLLVSNGTVSYYQFETPPNGQLAPPAEVKAAIDSQAAYERAAAQPGPPP